MEKEDKILIFKIQDEQLKEFIKSYEISFKQKFKLISVSPAFIMSDITRTWLVVFENTEWTA